jgi:hypothetical protein
MWIPGLAMVPEPPYLAEIINADHGLDGILSGLDHGLVPVGEWNVVCSLAVGGLSSCSISKWTYEDHRVLKVKRGCEPTLLAQV